MNQRQTAFAHFNRAANLYRQVCYAQAVQYYLAGLEVDPMCVEAYADLAKAYEKLGCWNQAIESLETALRLRPGYPTALRRKQRILEEKSVYDSLTDELNLALNAADQHQPTDADQRSSPTIEHEFFTLTGGAQSRRTYYGLYPKSLSIPIMRLAKFSNAIRSTMFLFLLKIPNK